MRILRSIIEPAPNFLPLDIAKFAHRRRIRIELIGDDRLGLAVTLQSLLKEAQFGLFIPYLGDIAFEHFSLVIDCTPQIVRLAVDFHKDLIDMPASLPRALHLADPLALDVCCKHRAGAVPPHASGVVADIDAAFKQHVFNVTLCQREANIHHHTNPNAVRRKIGKANEARQAFS